MTEARNAISLGDHGAAYCADAGLDIIADLKGRQLLPLDDDGLGSGDAVMRVDLLPYIRTRDNESPPGNKEGGWSM